MEETVKLQVNDFFKAIGELYMKLQYAERKIIELKLSKETNVQEPKEETDG